MTENNLRSSSSTYDETNSQYDNLGKVVTRDLRTVKVWDLRSPSTPFIEIPLKPNLEVEAYKDLYENQSIFEQYSAIPSNGCHIATEFTNYSI